MENKILDLEKRFQHYYDAVLKNSHLLWEFYYNPGHVSSDNVKVASFWVREYLENMYRIACVYLETQGLNEYLVAFKIKYSSIILDENKATNITSYPLLDGDDFEEMYLIHEWKNFLSPFNLFKQDISKDELLKLKELLKNTNNILKLTGIKVKNEESINGVVRDVLDLYYNNVIAFKEGFFRHSFKNYRPDVIIEEIGVAIEYKLIRKNDEISTKIDELIIDAKRYTGNSFNKKCLAVFCLSNKVTKTNKQIKEDWNKHKFPSNWDLIIINDIVID